MIVKLRSIDIRRAVKEGNVRAQSTFITPLAFHQAPHGMKICCFVHFLAATTELCPSWLLAFFTSHSPTGPLNILRIRLMSIS